MDWLLVLGKLIAIVSAVTDYLKDRQLIDAGKAMAISANLKGALDEIRSANQTKADVDARTSGPDAAERLRDDPGNLYRD